MYVVNMSFSEIYIISKYPDTMYVTYVCMLHMYVTYVLISNTHLAAFLPLTMHNFGIYDILRNTANISTYIVCVGLQFLGIGKP